jgi:hypothetical protein
MGFATKRLLLAGGIDACQRSGLSCLAVGFCGQGSVIVWTGVNAITALLVAGAAAIAIAAAPIASAAPSEQQCLQQHCLEAHAPTISQGPGNVQIFTSPKAMPAVFPRSRNPKWRGLGYNARWPALGHNPKWQDFGYSPRWNGFQTALMPVPGISPGGRR